MEYLFLLSRVLFGGYFLVSAYGHVTGYAGLLGYAKSKGTPMAEVLVPISGILLFIGGAGILLGVLVPWAVLAIELFLIPVSYYIHPYWKDTAPQAKMMDRIQFSKNVAIGAGALAFLAVQTPWMWSLMTLLK